MAHLKAGDEVLCGAAIYGGTLHLLHDLLANFAITPRFISLDEMANLERVFSDKTRMVWFESPINPTLRCVDIKRVADACKARGVLSVIDNTFASSINQQPLAIGIDLVDAERHEIPERPQRRDRRRGVGSKGAAGADREGAPAAGHGDGSASRLRARPGAENAAAARRAAQCERGRRRRLSRSGQAGQPRLLSGVAVASRSRNRKAPDDRLRRHGVFRPGRPLRPRRAALRPARGSSSAPRALAGSRA